MRAPAARRPTTPPGRQIGPGRSADSLDHIIRPGLARAMSRLEELGIALPTLGGQLSRPRTAIALVPGEMRAGLPDRFWLGCLAIQMVHEASLLHDDVIDQGMTRRGESTLVAEKGSGAALLHGDALLTGAYRAAHMVGSEGFMAAFVSSVERTVYGETLQSKPCAPSDRSKRHEEVVRAKSGQLFGAAAALAASFGGRRSLEEMHEVGVAVGEFYQLVDDFLDYCPATSTGKPKLQDFRNWVWTSAVGDVGPDWFQQAPGAAVSAWVADKEGGSAADQAHVRLESHASRIRRRLLSLGADPALTGQISDWLRLCCEALAREKRLGQGGLSLDATERRAGVEASTDKADRTAFVRAAALEVGRPDEWARYFSTNSRSFAFASALFPAHAKVVVQGVYAFCRFTDDLVDQSDLPAPELEAVLDTWAEVCGDAYAGRRTAIPLVDVVMSEMAERAVPFEYALELIEGVRMDIVPRAYSSTDDLEAYSYRVASVVGLWLTRGFGVTDPWVLQRAKALGHAMQLTNILRDVGEDLEMGRVYLPADRMAAHGIGRGSLVAMKDTGLISSQYEALIEELMSEADRGYDLAAEGIPGLPGFFQRPVAVASEVYRGIHDAIRSNGHDNLNLRAHTGFGRKVRLAGRALRSLHRQRRLHGGNSLIAPKPGVRVR
ncbi:MAG: squalene/phytoene synthase family protein [Longimicrobiales bacterium]